MRLSTLSHMFLVATEGLKKEEKEITQTQKTKVTEDTKYMWYSSRKCFSDYAYILYCIIFKIVF